MELSITGHGLSVVSSSFSCGQSGDCKRVVFSAEWEASGVMVWMVVVSIDLVLYITIRMHQFDSFEAEFVSNI